VTARARWDALLAPFGPEPAALGAVYAEIAARAQRDRLVRELELVERLEHRAADPCAVALAVWAGVLGPGWAAVALPRVGVPAGLVATVVRLVDGQPDPDDPDGGVLGDAGLEPLGDAAPEYRAHVERERLLSGLPAAEWRERRLRAVRALIRRDSVFRTPEMRASREGRAQLNLAREYAALMADSARSTV
jgi:predicted metal-dependent HD superfamily phosphohydrolase